MKELPILSDEEIKAVPRYAKRRDRVIAALQCAKCWRHEKAEIAKATKEERERVITIFKKAYTDTDCWRRYQDLIAEE